MRSLTLPIRRRAWPGRVTLRHALAGETEAACLLVSCQDEPAGWEPGVWVYHGVGKGLRLRSALYGTKEEIALNRPGFSLSASQPGRAFCWLLVSHPWLLSTSVLFTGGSALECLFTFSP